MKNPAAGQAISLKNCAAVTDKMAIHIFQELTKKTRRSGYENYNITHNRHRI